MVRAVAGPPVSRWVLDTPRGVGRMGGGGQYRSGVGMTRRSIFAGIAAAWLMYLVPYFLRHRGEDFADESGAEIPFAPSVTIVRSGTSLADADPGIEAEVSTPLTRRAQLRNLHLRDLQAAQRRRRVLIFLLLIAADRGLAIARIGAWWGGPDPGRPDRGVPGGGPVRCAGDAGRFQPGARPRSGTARTRRRSPSR